MTTDGETIVYQTYDGNVRLDVHWQGPVVWVIQAMMAELYGTTVSNVSMHLGNIVEEGELVAEGTVQDFLTVRQEGSRTVQREVDHYSLDAMQPVSGWRRVAQELGDAPERGRS